MMFLTKYQVTYIINPSMQKIDMTKCEGKDTEKQQVVFFYFLFLQGRVSKKFTGYVSDSDST